MRRTRFLILGAGQTGRLVAEIATRIPEVECVGFLDRDPSLIGRSFYGVPVVGSDEELPSYVGRVEGVLPVIGDLTARYRWFKRCEALGFELVRVIEPSVRYARDVRWGRGVVVSFGTNILTGVSVGDYAFIGTGVNILHDVRIGTNCVVGGGTTIGAGVLVGDHVSFGVGVQVASGTKRIGDNVRIAAGSVVLKDVPDQAFLLGNPARVIGRVPPVEI